MKVIFILLIIGLLGLVSCYDDKGNYDYKNINEITVEFPYFYFEQVLGEKLVVEPKLSYSLGDSVGLNLAFEWKFADKVVGNERRLEWVMDTAIQSNLVLRVKNLDNDLVSMASTTVRIGSIYTVNEGYLILSERNNKSLLTFAQLGYKTDENGEVVIDDNGNEIIEFQIVEDIYKRENDEELGTNPLFVREHNADIFPSYGHVTVFQEGGDGSVDLDGTSMRKDILLVDAFSGHVYPEDFHPVNAEFMDNVHLIQNYDGKIYSKIKETLELFQSGYYIHIPLMFENKEIRIDRLVNTIREQSRQMTLVHSVGTPDSPENRFLMIHDLKEDFYDVNFAGKVVALPEPENGVWPQGFIPLTNLGDNRIVNVGYIRGDWETDAAYGILLKTSNNSYVYQYFEIEREYSGEKLSYVKDAGSEVLKSWIIDSPIPLENCIFWTIPAASNPYLFIAYGKDIYFLDILAPQNGIRHYYTCKANVVVMNGRTYQGDHLMVGLDDGSLLLLNVAGAKNLQNEEKLLWESEPDVNLGKIVDLTLKTGTSL